MLEKYIESLENQGYYVMFTEYLDCCLLCIRISKSGLNIERYIPLYDFRNYILGIEKIKMNVLMDMVKELNANLKTNNNPRWTDYQVEALTDISNRLIQYGDHQSDNSLRSRLHSIATEVKNVIPMAMIKMKGEEKMRKDKHKIQIGDILYEPSKMYGKVIEHKILDIYFEGYVSGWKTMVVTESYLGRSTKFCSDVLYWPDNEEDAKAALDK